MPNADPRDRFFYPILTLMIDSYIIPGQDQITDLLENLKNAEDKFAAAEQTIKIQQEEIKTFHLTQEQISKSIEVRHNFGLDHTL